MLKGAIFDADGTLLDSMSIWEQLGRGIWRRLELQRSRSFRPFSRR